jgi:hypothetical protein
MKCSTIELEKLFYSGVENLEKVRDALTDEFAMIEDGDNTLISYITDSLTQADKLLNERTALYGRVVRALEIADGALDYYENLYLEEIRLAAEKNTEEKAKKPTDTVMKAQAAVRVSPYRRFRNIIRGYCSTCERSLASLRTSISKCQSESYLASKASYRPQEPEGENVN